MELINRTPVVGHLRVSKLEETPFRYGLLTAKATFEVDDKGRVRLDTQAPYPVFEADEPTPLGVLPSDVVPRRDRALEVIVLGSVYGRGQARQTVDLTVGAHRQRLLALGERRWSSAAPGARISEPEPFDVLPLTWARAYGGSADCWIDAHSVIDLEHPMNKYGRGFDAARLAEDVGKAFQAPPGYPRLAAKYRRELPNLEDPRHPIQRWEDDPRPYCWATVPMDIGVHSQRAQDRMRAHQPLSQAEMLELVYHRAHPDWILPIPPAGAKVTLRGMTPSGVWSFVLPRLRVLADYVLGERSGVRELDPHLLMLLPEESRFYLVYRHFFTMKVDKDTRREFRLRLAEGWVQ